MFLKLLFAKTVVSENKPTGDKLFNVLFIFSATASCCAFCACLAFVATNGNKPITEPAPLTKLACDVENTFIGIPYFLASCNMFSFTGMVLPASSILVPVCIFISSVTPKRFLPKYGFMNGHTC